MHKKSPVTIAGVGRLLEDVHGHVKQLDAGLPDLVARLDDIHAHVQALDSPTPTLADVAQRVEALAQFTHALGRMLMAAIRQIPTGGEPGDMSAADTAEVTRAFTAARDRLAGVAADPDNPDPVPDHPNSEEEKVGS
jgi:hypothetical protein